MSLNICLSFIICKKFNCSSKSSYEQQKALHICRHKKQVILEFQKDENSAVPSLETKVKVFIFELNLNF